MFIKWLRTDNLIQEEWFWAKDWWADEEEKVSTDIKQGLPKHAITLTATGHDCY